MLKITKSTPEVRIIETDTLVNLIIHCRGLYHQIQGRSFIGNDNEFLDYIIGNTEVSYADGLCQYIIMNS